MDISNGEGLGVALFVQGCHFHCHNCFNQDTWDFNKGHELTEEISNQFIFSASLPYITRVSILGGEPLALENRDGVCDLLAEITKLYPNKIIWLYTGYTWEQLHEEPVNNTIAKILNMVDILVDGRYIDELKDYTLKWKGSSNQRVINVNKSLESNKIILHKEGDKI